MIPFKNLLIIFMISFIPCLVSAQGASDMMNQYKGMGDNSGANFPKDLEKIIPKEFSVKSKTFVYEETQKMFLSAGLNLTRKNDVYPKFGFETELEIGFFGYNPGTAGYMAAQWPTLENETKKHWKMDGESSSGGWDNEPVKSYKIGRTDVFIQKKIRKNVGIDDFKHEDQTYYVAEAIMFYKNMMLKIRIVHYPLKADQVNAIIKEISEKFIATKWETYMN